SGRVRIPEILPPAGLADTIGAIGAADGARLVLDPVAAISLGPALELSGGVTLLIGPEGGLTEAERETARAADFQPVSLGPRILRTETAPLAALSIIQYLAGDLGC
ncbi:MAG: RsmE family RNA methyltransferase, partial [Gammaproteobacteria bacterium]